MLLRVALGRPVLTTSLAKTTFQVNFRQQPLLLRQFARDSRGSYIRTQLKQKPTLKERILAPAGPNAFAIGKGALAGGSVLGLGALCYYGLGLGSQANTLNNAMLWPEHVKQRIRSTYAYFGGSILISAASAVAVFRSPRMMSLVSRNGFWSIMATMAAMIGSGMVTRSIPYEQGVGTKQLAWLVHCGILGAVIAPMCFLGGPILTRAACYTAGVVGGLSAVAVCAPSDKFLYMGGPLAIGLGVVFASSLGSMFLPPTTALGAGLYSMSLYGGLLLFSGFLLYDTQRIIRKAETYPLYAARPYDPINAAISIYLDTLNIFIRIASILAGGGGRRK